MERAPRAPSASPRPLARRAYELLMAGLALDCALVLLFYTYVGYPLLVAAVARLRPRPVRKALPARLPRVSFLVAARNEERHIAAKLASCLAQDYPAELLQVVVVSDASTDRTDALVSATARADRRIVFHRLPARAGKPWALNQAAARASGDVLVFTDARQPIAANALAELVACLADPEVAAAGGELALEGDAASGLYWRYEAWIRRNESRAGSTPGLSGALYAIRRADFTPLPPETLLDDVLIPLRLQLRPAPAARRVIVDPSAVAYDTAAEIAHEFRRKARTLAGNFQLLALCPELLSPRRNPAWLQLVSHKLLRLAAPYALAVLLVASAAGGPLAHAFFLLQLAGYELAVLGALGRGGRASAACHAFVALHAAAVVALWRHLTSRQRVAWR